ncbi:hypothetical protein [Microbulbifer sp. PSTR4-B]|uniref:hypothetical protein n=1 Tax=Microbulbifer sp. PSTR4-B TaxID=3243396 RepID=UPI0040390B08
MGFQEFLILGGVLFAVWLRYRFVRARAEHEENFRRENERLEGSYQRTVETSSEEQIDSGEDYDAWEGGFWGATAPIKVNAHLQIDYKDGDGNSTTRSVKVKKFDELLSGGMVIGFCELRRATRTFRIDRISECMDLETGECISNVRDYLIDKFELSPERVIDTLELEFLDVLKILYFVAKADGQFKKGEAIVIAEYLRKLVSDDRVNFEMVDKVLRSYDVPSLQSFKLAVGRVMKAQEIDIDLLIDCCKKIVDTQKTVHPAEKAALEYMVKRQSMSLKAEV